MKKTKKTGPFDWSRHPSRENISKVFLADPQAMTSFGKSITKEEFSHSLDVYNQIMSLERKKKFFRDMFYTTLLLLPFAFFFYNVFIGVSK